VLWRRIFEVGDFSIPCLPRSRWRLMRRDGESANHWASNRCSAQESARAETMRTSGKSPNFTAEDKSTNHEGREVARRQHRKATNVADLLRVLL